MSYGKIGLPMGLKKEIHVLPFRGWGVFVQLKYPVL